MSDQFEPLAILLARKAELEAEAMTNRLRYEEVVGMIELIQRKGRQKPGPKPGTVRPMRVVTEPAELPLSSVAPADEGAA